MTTHFILRSRADGLFVCGAAAWSAFAAQAKAFPNAKAADEFVRSQRLKNMEIVVLRENAAQLRIPLGCRQTQ